MWYIPVGVSQPIMCTMCSSSASLMPQSIITYLIQTDIGSPPKSEVIIQPTAVTPLLTFLGISSVLIAVVKVLAPVQLSRSFATCTIYPAQRKNTLHIQLFENLLVLVH